MTYPLQENADGVFANRILRPEPEMQAMFSEIGLAHLQARRLSPARRRQGKPAGKKSPATANFFI